MKKLKSILLVMSLFLLFTGCSNSNDSYLKSISYKEFKTMCENKETFLNHGGVSYHYIPALNAEKAHIEMMGKLVLDKLK